MDRFIVSMLPQAHSPWHTDRQVALHDEILLKTNLFKIPALHFALNGSSAESDFKIPSRHFAWDGSSLESDFKIPSLHCMEW